MAVILLSYFSTMVSVFAALMFLLTNVFGSVSVHQARPVPHHVSAATRAVTLEHYAAAAKRDQDARLQVAVLSPAAPQMTPTAAGGDQVTRTAAKQTQKAKAVRLARNGQRAERLAGYSTLAMGYAPESREQSSAARVFNTIGSIAPSR